MLKAEYLMREQGMTQAELARQCGINRVTVNAILRGKVYVYPKYKRKFVDALNYEGNPDELFAPIEIVN